MSGICWRSIQRKKPTVIYLYKYSLVDINIEVFWLSINAFDFSITFVDKVASTQHIFQKKSLIMSNINAPSLLTLPVEIFYRILDKLDILTILLSCRNVCTRFNTIINTYHPYSVSFNIIFSLVIQHYWKYRHSPSWIWQKRISMMRNCYDYHMHYKTIR